MDPDNHNFDTDRAVLQAILQKNREFFQEISKIKTDSIQEIKLGQQSIPTSQLSDCVKDVLNMIHQFLRIDDDYLNDIPDLLSKIKPQLDSAEAEIARREKQPEDKKEQRLGQRAVAEPQGAHSGPYKRPAIENIESQEIGDVICRCDYDFDEIEELINKEEGIKEKLKLLVLKKLINLETKEPLEITMRGDSKKYQIVEEINIADELGEWRFHPFFDRMAVYLVRNGDQNFPVKWHVPKDFSSLEIKTEKRRSSGKALSGVNQTLLEFLEELAEKYEKDKSQAKSWAEALNSQAVDTVEELLRWGKKDFDELKSLPKQINLVLLQELNKFKFKAMSEAQAKLNAAEKKGIVHKIRRFLCYQTKKEDEEDELGYIDQKVLELAFNEVKTYYEGDSLLEQIKTFYLGYTVPMKRRGNIILERGMILHGPPGTGKTVLTDDLPLKMGLTPISHSLSASEVNRGIVGQTEKLLLDLCNRATKMPHLLCCVSIDEIDSLVPKRDEKSSQYKTDGIAVLLAVIGGIKDVPNLVILASTNRLNQIDDAIKRRLSGQFFVGRPSPASRKKIIQRINNEKNEPNQVIMDEKEIEETVKMTTNFSGAALKMLISKLLVYYKTQKKEGNLTPEEITKYATLTSKQFGIKLGTFYLPDLFQKRLDDQKRENQENFEAFCTIKQYQKSIKMDSECTISSMLAKTLAKPNDNNIKYGFTGRILVNLSDIVKTTIEYQLKDQLQLLIEERKMMSSTLNDLLPRFADFVAERNIDFIQLFNSDFLLDNNAFDEGKIMENISDKIEELRAYDRALLIIDMDSLCGVNVSKSESGMGSTVSYSLSNAKLFSLSIHSINTKAQITESRERWIALACKNPYLLGIVKESLNWRKTPKQIELENNEKENNTKERFCKKCAQKYLEAENKLGCCNYHDGFLFQSSKKPEFWEPIIEEALINALKADPKVNDFGLKYICCFEGYTSPGCKKDKHSEHNHNIPNYFDIFVSLKKFKSSNKI